MDDLITRLTAAIDGLAALAQRVKDVYVYPADHERAGEGFWPTPRVVHVFEEYSLGHAVGLDLVRLFGPDQVLRGCAADRKLIALHKHIQVPEEHIYLYKDGTVGCTECHYSHEREYVFNGGWCDHVKIIAGRYGLEVDGG